MARTEAKTIVENFYKYFNVSDLEKLFSLLSENIIHQINYGPVMKGKTEAIKYINFSIDHYKEHVSDYILMVSDEGHHVTAKFKTTGKYLKTDDSLIPARGQNYELTVFNYFEIENNKIVKALCFFDEKDLMRQLNEQ